MRLKRISTPWGAPRRLDGSDGATKVGIREFRAGISDYIDADAPIVVTRHGQTVGYFIPTKSDRQAEAVALKTATEKLEALLDLDEADVDAVVDTAVGEFKQLRRGAKEVVVAAERQLVLDADPGDGDRGVSAWQMRGRTANGDRSRPTAANAFAQFSSAMPMIASNTAEVPLPLALLSSGSCSCVAAAAAGAGAA